MYLTFFIIIFIKIIFIFNESNLNYNEQLERFVFIYKNYYESSNKNFDKKNKMILNKENSIIKIWKNHKNNLDNFLEYLSNKLLFFNEQNKKLFIDNIKNNFYIDHFKWNKIDIIYKPTNNNNNYKYISFYLSGNDIENIYHFILYIESSEIILNNKNNSFIIFNYKENFNNFELFNENKILYNNYNLILKNFLNNEKNIIYNMFENEIKTLNNNYNVLKIKLEYNINETNNNNNIYLIGKYININKTINIKLKKEKNNIYFTEIIIDNNNYNDIIEFKFNLNNNNFENGPNRLLFLNQINELYNNKKILSIYYIWNKFNLTFYLNFPIHKHNYIFYITISNNIYKNKTIKKKLTYSNITYINENNHKFEGNFFTTNFILDASIEKNFNFHYLYSYDDLEKNLTIYEREPQRHITIINDINNISYFEHNLRNIFNYNSHVKRFDFNFVSEFIFNKIGKYNIYLGPYPQNLSDFQEIKKQGINTILNVQSDKDFKDRNINFEMDLNICKQLNIDIIRFPIIDFNPVDLENKLFEAGKLINELLLKGKIIYVHCTAGLSRSAASILIYLVFYENFSFEEAKDYILKYHLIKPNYDVIKKVIKKYKK